MQASIAGIVMWAKFRVKIQNYSFTTEMGCYIENSPKNRYLASNMPESSTFLPQTQLNKGYKVRETSAGKHSGTWECSIVSLNFASFKALSCILCV